MSTFEMQSLPDMVQYLRWTHGGHIDFFLANASAIESFITQNRLTPVEPAHYAMSLQINTKAQTAAAVTDPSGYFGGMLLAHLHFKGGVYLLTQQQWNSFCGQTMQTYRERLSKVNSVSFESLLAFGEAAERVL